MEDKNRVIVQLDSKNTFNLISRQHFLNEANKVVPGGARYNYWMYGQPSTLHFGPHVVTLEEGTHQGNPLSSGHYAVGLHTKLIEVAQAHPSLDINNAYTDDWDLAGEGREVEQAFSLREATGPEISIHLRRDKCLASFLNGKDDPTILEGVPRCLDGNFKCLGSPIGTKDYCLQYTRGKIEKVRKLINLLEKFDDTHAAFMLFKYCATYPKIVFLV